ncbi:hypothetical protein HDU79_005022 [Rhizoclosmatium sp. JEL0117]|nr:hypothetical protein HDU79_005022 [Rhizoclosmatium sp. JEL0117]
MSTLFRRKEFAVAVVSFATFVDTVVYSIIIPTIPFILDDLGADRSLVGVLLGIYGLGVIVGSVLFGYLSLTSSRSSRKKQMIFALLLLVAATVLFSVGNSVALLGFARFLQGVAVNGTWVLGLALIADLYREHQNQAGKAMSIVMAGYSTGQLVGPPIGGVLYSYSHYAPFIFCAAVVLVDLFGRLMVVEPESIAQPEVAVESGPKIETQETGDAENKDAIVVEVEGIKKHSGIRQLLTIKPMWIILFLNTIISISQYGIEPTLPLKLNEEYGWDSSHIGLMYIALIIPLIIGGLLGGASADKYGIRTTLALGFGTSSIAFYILAIPGPHHVAWTAFTLVLLGLSIGYATVLTIGISSYVPPEYVTIAYSLMTIVFAIGLLVGPIAGAFIYQAIGWTWHVHIFAIAMTLATPFVFMLPPVQK